MMTCLYALTGVLWGEMCVPLLAGWKGGGSSCSAPVTVRPNPLPILHGHRQARHILTLETVLTPSTSNVTPRRTLPSSHAIV